MHNTNPEGYVPSETGKYLEIDKWDMVGGKLTKTGERFVVPLVFWETHYKQDADITMSNLAEDNPVRVKPKYTWYEKLYLEIGPFLRRQCDRLFKKSKT